MNQPLYNGQEVYFVNHRNKIYYGIIVKNYEHITNTIVCIFEDFGVSEPAVVSMELCIPWYSIEDQYE